MSRLQLPSSYQSIIHLALSPWDLTDDYNRHAGVTLLSFLDHCNKDTQVIVHLLYDAKLSIGKEQETEYNKSCYQKIAEQYNCSVFFHPIELPEWLNSIPAIKTYTPGTMLRLYLPDILPEVDKIIYIDCDIVVLTDIDVLWRVPVDTYYLAGCLDRVVIASSTGLRKKYQQKRGIPTDKYFNAGVLLLNLNKIRLESPDFTDRLMQYLHDTPDLNFLDQDLLNWFCQGKFFILNEKYNVFSHRRDAFVFVDDCILHYASRGKPWKRYGGKIDDPYWKYLVQTPWAEDRGKLAQYVRAAPDISKCFSILPVYYHHQDGLGYSAIAVRMMKLSLCLLAEIVRGFFLFVVAKFRRFRIL